MANQIVADLVAAVAAENTVISGAIVLINGFSQRLADGIAAALAGGASAADLAPLTDLKADIDAHAKALGDAVQANTTP